MYYSEKQMFLYTLEVNETKLLLKKPKERFYKVLAGPVIMYACETWPITQEDEKKLAVMERKFLTDKKKND